MSRVALIAVGLGRVQRGFVAAAAVVVELLFAAIPSIAIPQKRKGRCRRRQAKEKLGGLGRRRRVRFARVPQKRSGYPVRWAIPVRMIPLAVAAALAAALLYLPAACFSGAVNASAPHLLFRRKAVA